MSLILLLPSTHKSTTVTSDPDTAEATVISLTTITTEHTGYSATAAINTTNDTQTSDRKNNSNNNSTSNTTTTTRWSCGRCIPFNMIPLQTNIIVNCVTESKDTNCTVYR